jgi:predicted permease
MDLLRILLSRCAALFRRKRLDAELDEELQSHIDFAFEENLARGMSEAEARRAALVKFGGMTQIREKYRVRRGLPFLEQMARDLRFGLRQLRRSPGFAITAILTLALGLGANTAVFSLINGLLLRPLPVPRADELAVVHISDDDNQIGGFCAPLFRALEKRHEAFQAVAAYSNSKFEVRGSSGNVEVPGALVSGEFFQALQTQPLLGRALTPQDDQPGGGTAGFGVVISEGFWRSWFNGAPDVVGRRLTIANAAFTVVGVMPRQFIGADPLHRPEIYATLWAEPVIDAPYDNMTDGYHAWWLEVIARRNPGISLEQANAALKVASSQVLDGAISDPTGTPDPNWILDERAHHFQFVAAPGSKGFSYLGRHFRRPLLAVFRLCAAMLLLTCLNLASLLMARAAARERELATRLALGATRKRLIRQLMVESLLIAVLGTLAGMVAAPMVSRSLATFVLGNERNGTLDTSLDLRVFLFAALTAGVAALLIGLVPALRATSENLNEQIKNGSQARSPRERRRWLPRILMGLEVALALMLVVGAGLLGTSLSRIYRTGLGFDPKGVVNLDLEMGKQSLDGDALFRWYRDFGDALSHQPGVKSLSFASVTPLSGSAWTKTLHTPSSHGDRETYMNDVAPGYFQTMRITQVSGRDFQWADTASTGKKIILNQSAAKLLFPGQEAIGKIVSDWKNRPYQVIGVVADTRYLSIQEDAPAGGYVPITQSEGSKPSYTAVVRLEGPVGPFASAVRTLAARMAPEIPPPTMTKMSTILDASIGEERMMALLAAFFAGCSLLVTAIGLYGTLAYSTARRTSEIGIRMALGAQRAQVVGMVFRENAWIALGGSLAGLVAALLASRMLASFLYGTSVRDPWVMAASVAALTIIASAASLVPAVRAARIEPMSALRAE